LLFAQRWIDHCEKRSCVIIQHNKNILNLSASKFPIQNPEYVKCIESEARYESFRHPDFNFFKENLKVLLHRCDSEISSYTNHKYSQPSPTVRRLYEWVDANHTRMHVLINFELVHTFRIDAIVWRQHLLSW